MIEGRFSNLLISPRLCTVYYQMIDQINAMNIRDMHDEYEGGCILKVSYLGTNLLD